MASFLLWPLCQRLSGWAWPEIREPNLGRDVPDEIPPKTVVWWNRLKMGPFGDGSERHKTFPRPTAGFWDKSLKCRVNKRLRSSKQNRHLWLANVSFKYLISTFVCPFMSVSCTTSLFIGIASKNKTVFSFLYIFILHSQSLSLSLSLSHSLSFPLMSWPLYYSPWG